MRFPSRRNVLLGGASAALVAVAAAIGNRMLRVQQRVSLAEVDYLNGDVVVIDGWIVSKSEAAEAHNS